ncbi:MAG: hypothetical protein HY454_04050 [Parcubacteria group bacterium]|nr:hypothetical protein [Parcubacteria group bacterium]
MMDTAGQGQHDKMHWGCCWMPALGKILWVLGLLSLLGGLTALARGGEFYGVSYATWYWNALVGGVLALGAKVSKWHYCWHQKHG